MTPPPSWLSCLRRDFITYYDKCSILLYESHEEPSGSLRRPRQDSTTAQSAISAPTDRQRIVRTSYKLNCLAFAQRYKLRPPLTAVPWKLYRLQIAFGHWAIPGSATLFPFSFKGQVGALTAEPISRARPLIASQLERKPLVSVAG